MMFCGWHGYRMKFLMQKELLAKLKNNGNAFVFDINLFYYFEKQCSGIFLKGITLLKHLACYFSFIAKGFSLYLISDEPVFHAKLFWAIKIQQF